MKASVETGFQFSTPRRRHARCCRGWSSHWFRWPDFFRSNMISKLKFTFLPLLLGGGTSVRYQDGFSRKVQFISSLESGQSMFKSHLFPKLEVNVQCSSRIFTQSWRWAFTVKVKRFSKMEMKVKVEKNMKIMKTNSIQVPSLQLKLSLSHGVRFNWIRSFPWTQSSYNSISKRLNTIMKSPPLTH